MVIRFLPAIFCLLMAHISPCYSAIAYQESASGDLSNNRLIPTAVTLEVGSNEIHGSTGSNGSIDLDYFTVNIPTGFQLASITVLGDTAAGGSFSFIGIQAGNQITVLPNGGSAAGLLGWWHYSNGDIGTDIFDNMGIPSFGSTGFTPPLPAGAYAFWIQDFNPGVSPYGFDLNVAAVPLPSAMLLMPSGLGILSFLGFRRSRLQHAKCAHPS